MPRQADQPPLVPPGFGNGPQVPSSRKQSRSFVGVRPDRDQQRGKIALRRQYNPVQKKGVTRSWQVGWESPTDLLFVFCRGWGGGLELQNMHADDGCGCGAHTLEFFV